MRRILSARGGFVQFFRPEMGRWFQTLAFIAVLSSCSIAAVQQDLKSLVQRAFDLHQKGKFSEALPLLHRAYTLEPDDYFVNLLLGINSLRTGQPKSAVPFLKRASRLRPREEFPLDYLGEAYARQDIYGEAAEAYLKAVRLAPGSAESSVAFVDFALTRFGGMSELLRSSRKGLAAEFRLRALALKENDVPRLSLLQRAADLDAAAPGIWSDLARSALASGDLNGAERYSQQALEADPNDQAAWIASAQLAAQKSDWQRAGARLDSVAQHSPTMLSQAVGKWPPKLQPLTPSAVAGPAAKFLSCVRSARNPCNLGPGSKSSSNSSTALYREQRWEQMTKLPAPQHVRTEAWFQRGVAFAKLDDCQQAIPSLERGLFKSAPEVYGMFLLSWCYSREAGRTAEKVQQSGGDEAPLHIMRGDILLRLQAKAERAVSEYQLALAKDPNDPAVLERLADAQFGAGKIEVSRQNAQAALKIDAQRVAAKRTIAKIAMQERDYATALPYLQELAARNPHDLTLRIELARAFAQTGASDEAWRNLTPALAQGYPDEKGSLHYLLGTILKKMGRTAEADQAFATATQLSEAFQHKSYRDQDPDAQP
jgi:tetratricopeptide (TPR) repeat protein